MTATNPRSSASVRTFEAIARSALSGKLERV
jgi:hypothetical protein